MELDVLRQVSPGKRTIIFPGPGDEAHLSLSSSQGPSAPDLFSSYFHKLSLVLFFVPPLHHFIIFSFVIILLLLLPGTICFLVDLLNPEQAAFPFSEVFYWSPPNLLHPHTPGPRAFTSPTLRFTLDTQSLQFFNSNRFNLKDIQVWSSKKAALQQQVTSDICTFRLRSPANRLHSSLKLSFIIQSIKYLKQNMKELLGCPLLPLSTSKTLYG